ncbi:hypothetical protein L208DRAFT_1299046, partial [Tricholoma matsutake]
MTQLILYIGKKVPCEAILLYCLNLPFHLQYRFENTFIVGLTPPHLPHPTTISHLLEPVIKSVAKYGAAPGPNLPTSRYPDGISVKAKIEPVIVDLEGSHKATGFLGHGATMFCSFCLCTSDQLEDLNIQSWELRNGVQTTGVRWTPLHNLPYWDPVKHVVLGFVHNWLEGVFQHHLCAPWGIGQDEDESQNVKEVEKDEQWSEADVLDSAEE